MAVTTTIARHYAWRHGFMIVLCAGFALWGAYDLWIKIPRQERTHTRHNDVLKRVDEIQSIKQSRPLSSVEIAEAEKLDAEQKELAPGGALPTKPGEFDRLTCWIFIASILFVPYFAVDLRRIVARVYRLDDDGTLHLPPGTQPSATWPAGQIADMDMSRWMAKSIATVVHADGTRVKLDDYKHRNLHLIVGALAARFYPEEWTEEAKPVKPPAEEPPDEGGTAGDEGGEEIAEAAGAAAGRDGDERG